MASEDDDNAEEREDGKRSGGVHALEAVGLLAAGAAAALGAKAVLDARRRGTVTRELPLVGRASASGEDLPTVLRRAAFDVAVAATGQAADSLASEDAAERTR